MILDLSYSHANLKGKIKIYKYWFLRILGDDFETFQKWVFIPGESEKSGAFNGLWRRIEPLDYRQLTFSMQPRF